MSDDPQLKSAGQGPVTLDYTTPQPADPHSLMNAVAIGMVLATVTSFLGTVGAWDTANHIFLVLFIGFGIGAVITGLSSLWQTRKQHRSPWQVKLAVAIGSLAVLWGVLAVVLITHDPYRKFAHTKCQSNLRTVGMATQLYANDRGGILPAKFDELIAHADIGPEFFVCPHSHDSKATGATTRQLLADFAKPRRCSYVYLGAGLSNSTRTPKHVLAYEPIGNHDSTGANFLMGDGTVLWLDEKKAQKLIKQLEAGVNPPGP
jgi:hypothetical protein